ncbi:MAG: hypothetical protein WD009_07070 [Phycisphaeraceae bacterium]
MRVARLANNPIITRDVAVALERDGRNVNGPSLIRVPAWVSNPLARYYLYFAHHDGTSIRLALADALDGPWRIHEPGTLQLDQTPFNRHIASPDAHVDEAGKRIVMYYHGCCNKDPAIPWPQYSCVATSCDGVSFESRREPLCQSYLRMFTWRGRHYGIAMPGELYRSADGLTNFEARPGVLRQVLSETGRRPGDHPVRPRHFAVQVRGDTLWVFFSRIGDCPERILLTRIALEEDWLRWCPAEPVTLLEPEQPWEGVDAPLQPSAGGLSYDRVRQVRDPAIYEEAGRTWLLYTIAGEAGLAIAELHDT